MRRLLNCLSCLLFLLPIFSRQTAAIPIDNGVETEPVIECGAGYIGVSFSLRNNFDGHVYVKGRYNESQCRTDGTGRRTANIRLSFSSCGVQRTRSLNPKGIYIEAVIVITFHPKFITKVDRAYATRCFYVETEKPAVVQLEVSELTTILQTQRVPMPVCRYEVLDGSINGPPVRYAIVGQQVYHKWTCETDAVNVFCMYVNSCYVADGVGEEVQILDSTGCAVDRYVLQNLEYVNELVAGQEAHVFKFADRTALYFQCQIVITVRDAQAPCPRPACTTGSQAPAGKLVEPEQNHSSSNEALYRTTPPTVQTTAATTITDRRRSRTRFKRAENSPHEGREVNVWDVRAPVIDAFDVDVEGSLALNLSPVLQGRFGVANRTLASGDLYCLQSSSTVFLLSLVVGSLLAVAVSSFIFCMRRRPRRGVGQKLC